MKKSRFTDRQTCSRYEAKGNAENEEVANWLIRLTDNNRNWDFGLCFLYLRNVKGFGWNHKRPNMALGGITPIQRLAMAA